MKAAIPSAWSSVSNSAKNASRSRGQPVGQRPLRGRRMARFAARTASGGIVAIRAASSSAASTVASAGTTARDEAGRLRLDRADIERPVRISSIARALPIARVSRCVPPAPGMTPSRISGWPNVASSPATIMSQVIASSQPPPRANPRTAAMSGRPTAASRSQASNRPPGAQRRGRLRRRAP